MKENKSSISKAHSYEEIGEFWDNHDLDEYWHQTHPVEFEVDIKSKGPHPSVPTASRRAEPVELFYSYSHKDEKLRDKLDNHLALLQRQESIKEWHDRQIEAGDDWENEINEHLNSAQIILLLVSDDFIASDYCYSIEMKRALERHERADARVIPIILRPVDWESSPFGKLEALPKQGKPVTTWKNRDEAFKSIAQGIRKVIKEFRPKPTQSSGSAVIPRPPVVGFVARRDDQGRDIVERLKEELAPQKNQLIALNGPGGVGKTTLAAEAARALSEVFAKRIVWIGAGGREDFAFSTLLDEIATQLGQTGLRTLAPEPKAGQVQALIASRPTLIILDNFETIATAEQTLCIEFLLNRATCPALITIRQKINSARNITIPVMSPEEADDFLQRLIEQASDPSSFGKLDRDRIMQASERNPLILQWVMGQIDLAQEPDTVLDELAHGVGDAAQRVFDRSFRLEHLGDDGRAALLALSLFAPDASRTALVEVASFGEDVKRLNEAVKRLAGLWLVKTTAGGQRLTVEGLTRSLAKSSLSKDEHADGFRQQFVAYFLSYAKAHSQPKVEDYDALEAEKDNVLSAMDVAFALQNWESVIQLMRAINFEGVNGYLRIRGYWDEAIRRGEQAQKAARRAHDDWSVAQFAGSTAIIRADRGEYDEARRAHQRALIEFRKLGSDGNVAASLHSLAIIAQKQSDLSEARRLYNESLEINKKLGNQSGIAITLHQLAMLAQDQGDLAEARQLYNESLEIEKKLGSQNGIASTLHQLAMLAQDQGDLAEARQLYNESLEIKKKVGNQSGIAGTLHQLGRLAQAQGDLAEALQLYNESLEINKKLGNQSGIAITLHQLARLAEAQGDLAEARQLYNESLGINKKLGNQSGIAITLHALAMLAQDQGDLAEARQLYNESLEIKKKLGNQSGIAITLHQLAMLAQAQGDLAEARQLYNESLEINKKLGDQSGIAISLGQLGRLAEDEGNKIEAARLFREALIIFEKLKSPNAEITRRNLERVKGKSS